MVVIPVCFAVMLFAIPSHADPNPTSGHVDGVLVTASLTRATRSATASTTSSSTSIGHVVNVTVYGNYYDDIDKEMKYTTASNNSQYHASVSATASFNAPYTSYYALSSHGAYSTNGSSWTANLSD